MGWICDMHGDGLYMWCAWGWAGYVICMGMGCICCVHGDGLYMCYAWGWAGYVICMGMGCVCGVHGDGLDVICMGMGRREVRPLSVTSVFHYLPCAVRPSIFSPLVHDVRRNECDYYLRFITTATTNIAAFSDVILPCYTASHRRIHKF
jgi:hypothetical protein